MRNIIYLFIVIFFTSCGGGGGESTSARPKNVIYSSPSTLQSDNFSRYQWYIDDKALYVDRFAELKDIKTVGYHDMNLGSVYRNSDNSIRYIGYNNGQPILVQVVDTGIDAKHEDLERNIDLNSSYNSATGLSDPTPSDFTAESHGTNVAGIIGAIGYNNVGIKGVAPSVKLAGYKLTDSNGNFDASLPNLQRAWFSGPNAENIAVSNNSWGYCFNKASAAKDDLLKMGAEQLRGNKGRVYVFAAGNGRNGNDICPNPTKMESANTDYFQNSQYSISVAALNNDNVYASYSTPGSNILVTSYSGDGDILMLTTAPTGSSQWYSSAQEDTTRSYDFSFAGTSGSAPTVSGAIALVLEACPDLTYRDVKYLIATTALNDINIDSTKRVGEGGSWVTNNAGRRHSNDYGFGLINTEKIIDTCLDSSYNRLGGKQTSTSSDNDSGTLPVSVTGTITRNIDISGIMSIEWVGLTIYTDYNQPEALEIVLVSPGGTRSQLLHSDNALGTNAEVVSKFSSGFRLSSVAFLDETSNGTWTIEVRTNSSTGIGDLTNLTLEVVGN